MLVFSVIEVSWYRSGHDLTRSWPI